MGLPETLLIVLGAAVLMALVLGLLLRNALRGRSSAGDAQGAAATAAELETLKTANAELGRKLAVEEFKASRLVEVEAALTDVSGRLEALREGKAGTDGELAAARQEAAGLREVEADLRERLANAGTAVDTAEADTVAMREAKSAVDEVLYPVHARTRKIESATSQRLGRFNRFGNFGFSWRHSRNRPDKVETFGRCFLETIQR